MSNREALWKIRSPKGFLTRRRGSENVERDAMKASDSRKHESKDFEINK